MRTSIVGVLLVLMGCAGNEHAVEHQPIHGRQHTHGHHAANHPGASEGSPPADHSDHHGHHRFDDPASYAEMLDHPDRDGWQRPAEVIRLMSLAEGMTVADLGAGTGYFLEHLSPAVGEQGRVLALDVEQSMVDWMVERIGREGLSNVEAQLIPTDAPGLSPESTDRVLIVNTWHHISDRGAYAAQLREALRPGGQVVVVDFTMESEHGPPPAMRLTPDTIIEELMAGGLEATLVEEQLPMQYVVVARRPAAD